MSIKINSLEIENVKRVKAIQVDFNQKGLSVIGGNNGQGKTSVLDSICYALGGERYKPSTLKREGSMAEPSIRLTLNNGIVVMRKGKNASLKVFDPQARGNGQSLLNMFIEQFALDLPKFMNATSGEKAKILLKILGIGKELQDLTEKEQQLYNERLATGQIAYRKKKYADELPFYDDAPKDLITASELIQEQQAVLARNGDNQQKRSQVKQIENRLDIVERDVFSLQSQMENIQKQLTERQKEKDQLSVDLITARKSVEQLQDESTEEIEKRINDIELINTKVRTNFDKQKAEDDAEKLKKEYDALTAQIEQVRTDRLNLLNGAKLPLPELSIDSDHELTFNGNKWDCMSGSEQLVVATSIVKCLNPECGFVLLDKLEQMDEITLQKFGNYLETENLQAIATRVSTGSECSIIIEDGEVKNNQTKTETKAF